MPPTVAGRFGERGLEAAAIAVAGTAGFLADGAGAVPVAAVVGFFAAKSVESLRLALA
ncbi:uncharacterized protein HHUB_2691 [Halobacterium hubeiense]|uniref:Uncharacterized protein n=1 Tax=Halobacterium hubeiense TaxID=1407499 RepID=A0A0U5CYT0_9EURY|nr:hypothetical protein [Halobacterium hubeiense]CQH58180.1 uncharacterized protein HHUB_2691 [Halobacterium hubeiense]